MTVGVACLDETRALAFVAGDVPADLRESIEEHVDDCASCRQVLAALMKSDREPAEPDAWTPGRRIGRYIVLAEIGRGAMGSVYRAEDVELARQVALKRLHAAGDRDRLIREARAVAQLSHPNVVTVHEVGEIAGAAFLAMELVDGATLRAWLKERRRTPAEIAHVIAQAGRGLAAAHERGLVHRDFKPDNVLVDRGGRVRVADFGLARGGDAPITQVGSIAGTPAYLAPEVVAGAPPDARSDQYALAVTLFEALHGMHPFDGDTPRRMWTEMANGRIRKGSRDVPVRFDRIARRGLAVDPADRWPDLASLVAALERPPRRRWPYLAAAGGAVAAAVAVFLVVHTREASCDGAGQEIARIWPGRWATIASVAAPAHIHGITEAFGHFAADWRAAQHASCVDAVRGKQPRDITEKRDGCLMRARLAALETAIQLEDPKVRPAALALAQALPDVGPCEDIDRLRKMDPLPSAPDVRETLENVEMALVRARAARELGELKTALHELDYAHDVGQQYTDRTLVARAALLRYELDRDKGDESAASMQALEAWTAASAVGDKDLTLRAQMALIGSEARGNKKAIEGLAAITDVPESREGAVLQASHGDALLAAGRYHEAEAAYRAAQTIRDKVLPEDHIERVFGLYEVGAVLAEQHDMAAARPLLLQAKARLDVLASPWSHQAIELRHVLSQVEAALGHTELAGTYAREVLERRSKLYGEHSAQAAIARNDLANALAAANQHAESAQQYQITVADFIAAVGEASPNAAESRVDLANQLTDLERFDEAEATLEQAIPVLVRVDGADHPHVAVAEYSLVSTWLQRKPPTNLARAGELLDHVEKVFTKSFGLDSQPMAALQEARGELLAAKHDYAGADRLLVVGLAMLPATDLKDRAEVELLRAHVLWQLGRHEEAKATAASAIEHFQAAGASFAAEIAKGRAWLANPS